MSGVVKNADYLLVDRHIGNRFVCDFKCTLHDGSYTADAVIDTGASSILIPLKSLGISNDKIMELKEMYIKSNKPIRLLHGVEGTYTKEEEIELKNLSFNEKMGKDGLVFDDRISDLFLNGYSIGGGIVHVNCDTTGNILVGMPILSKLNIHLGYSSITKSDVLIGCFRNVIHPAYHTALEEHLKLYAWSKVLDVAAEAKSEAIHEVHKRNVAAAFNDYFLSMFKKP